MKALSLWQPWATLIAIGAKRIETRSWYTDYRGPLLIHAAKKWNRDLQEMCLTQPFRSTLMRHRPNRGGAFIQEDALKMILPFGAIIAKCTLYACESAHMASADISANELAFGDYSRGRFAWFLKDVEAIAPIPCIGRQGLFNVDLEALRRAAA